MATSTKRIRTKAMIQCVEEAGKCELCGSIKGLEAHHIIPVACGGSENHENLICVCRVCHTKLTPHSELTKIGLRKRNILNALKVHIYKRAESNLERGVSGVEAVCDALDEIEDTPALWKSIEEILIENRWA